MQIGGYMLMKQMNKKGVTLIELVVVMGIIAIGAMLLIPNIGAWLPNYRLRSATRDVVSTMRTAQMKAVSTNTQYQVLFTIPAPPDPTSFIIQYQDTGGNWVNDGAAQTLPAGISISTTFGGNNAVFNPNSTSSAGSVTLQNTKGAQRKITLASATGRAKIE